MAWLRSLLVMVLLAVPATAAGMPRRVLIIHSFGRDFAPFHEVASEFRTQLARQSPEPVEFLEGSLEMAPLDGAERDQPLFAFLLAVFSGAQPDLIVPIGGPAALFLGRHRDALFPGSPILVVGVD